MDEKVKEQIEEAISSLDYGEITITLRASKIIRVQINKSLDLFKRDAKN